MRTEGHDRVGAPAALSKYGMLRCKFNRENKILSVDMSFDVMNFMQQYQVGSFLHAALILLSALLFSQLSVRSFQIPLRWQSNQPLR
jgi:hypothetical protein